MQLIVKLLVLSFIILSYSNLVHSKVRKPNNNDKKIKFRVDLRASYKFLTYKTTDKIVEAACPGQIMQNLVESRVNAFQKKYNELTVKAKNDTLSIEALKLDEGGEGYPSSYRVVAVLQIKLPSECFISSENILIK